ncbi:hypothetical protein FRC07_006297 [Ceratobasidium sp. 392]|nr:hypothetical protein FRC07_006297 [Ceratobasidium sp. 392]
MFYLLLLVTFIAGLVVVTGVGAISSTVYFLLNYPPVLAIVVIAFCLIAPSDDGHTCEQRDAYGRLIPCYPAPGSERMGRMCRAAERRRALRRLWRDVAYFANIYTRGARPGVAVVRTLLREVYKCLREVCKCIREGAVCLAPIVMSAAALVVKAFCVSDTARRVMVVLIVVCALAYLLASVVAGLLLDECNTPGLGCILSYFTQFTIVVGLFHRPIWQYAKTTGTVSRILAGMHAEMDEYDASPDGSTRRGKHARTCAQPKVKQKESRTSTRSSQSSSPTKYPAQHSKTGGSDSSPSSSLSSIAQSSMSTSRVSQNENDMASSPATSVGSVEGKKHKKSEPAAIPRADGATKKQSSKPKVLNQNVQSKRDQVVGASESARSATAPHVPRSKTGNSDPNSSLGSIAESPTSVRRASRNENGLASSPATSVDSVEVKKHTKTECKPIPVAIPCADGAAKKQSLKSKASNQTVQRKRDQVAGGPESARGAMASRIPKPTSKESNAVAAGSYNVPTLSSVTKTKGQVEAEMEKVKSKAEKGIPAEPTSAETASKANANIAQVTREKAAESEKTDLSKAKTVVVSTPVGTISSTSQSTLPQKPTSELEPSLPISNLNTSTGQKVQTSPEHSSKPIAALFESRVETRMDPTSSPVPMTKQPSSSDELSITSRNDVPTSPSPTQASIDPKLTEQSARASQVDSGSEFAIKTLSRATFVRAIHMYAPAPYPQLNNPSFATRAARAELKMKQMAKKARLTRLPVRLAAKLTATPAHTAKPNEPSEISVVQSQVVDVPEMTMAITSAALDTEADVRQPLAASRETTTIVCATSDRTPSAVQSTSPTKASSEEVSTAAQSAIQSAPSLVVPAAPKVTMSFSQPATAPRAPPPIRCKPVDGASFFKSYKPAPRPAPLASSTKSSESDATQARAPLVPAPNTSASAAGPSINHAPMEKELLAARKETFQVKQPSMGTESDLDLALAAAPAAPGACRQLGRVETKKATVKKNVMYTTDVQGKKQVKAGEVKKDEYVYKWSLDLGMPGVKMRAPKELWEGN